MATPVVFNGVNYSVPAFGDVGYAQGPGNLSAYLIAIASGTFQPTGGLFSLTADADFGPNFGLVSIYYKSASADIAQSGVLRLANTDTIAWRDFANAGDLPLAVNASDQLTFDGIVLSTAPVTGTVNTGTAGRLTLYPATGNTVDDVYIQNSQNIDILIAAQATRSVGLEYTIPNPGDAVAASTFALLELAQTFTAAQTFAVTVTISATTNQLILGTTNTTTITSPAPAASRVYTIPDAGGAASFLMSAGAQTVTGAKTFADQTLLLQETGGTDVITINVAALAASRAYTMPDAGGAASFVMTAGAQSIAGIKTFTAGAGAITMSGSTIAMGANKITGLADGTVSTDAAAFGQISGKRILQIVSFTTTTPFSTTSGSYQTTNTTASITPSSTSSKILILANSTIENNNGATANAFASLFRGATDLGPASGQGFLTSDINSASISRMPASIMYVDSPASVSSTTYSIKIRNDAGAVTVSWGIQTGAALGGQFMTLMEIG